MESGGITRNYAGFGGITRDYAGFGGIWRDYAGFGGIWRDYAGFGGIWRDLAGLAGLAGLGVAPRLSNTKMLGLDGLECEYFQTSQVLATSV